MRKLTPGADDTVDNTDFVVGRPTETSDDFSPEITTATEASEDSSSFTSVSDSESNDASTISNEDAEVPEDSTDSVVASSDQVEDALH